VVGHTNRPEVLDPPAASRPPTTGSDHPAAHVTEREAILRTLQRQRSCRRTSTLTCRPAPRLLRADPGTPHAGGHLAVRVERDV
jgi:hypothetical protein